MRVSLHKDKAAAKLPLVPVHLPLEELEVEEPSRSLRLTFPEEVVIGNGSLTVRHKVEVDLRELESDFFSEVSLLSAAAIVERLGALTMVISFPPPLSFSLVT